MVSAQPQPHYPPNGSSCLSSDQRQHVYWAELAHIADGPDLFLWALIVALHSTAPSDSPTPALHSSAGPSSAHSIAERTLQKLFTLEKDLRSITDPRQRRACVEHSPLPALIVSTVEHANESSENTDESNTAGDNSQKSTMIAHRTRRLHSAVVSRILSWAH